MTVWVLLPAFNEEDALPKLTRKIGEAASQHSWDYRIVVVNDGSTDRTAALLERLKRQCPLDVIEHRFNRGLGETARDGFEYIAEHGSPDDVLIRLDCDDTHEPKYMPEMIAKLDEGYDVVITSRYAPGGGEVGLDWYRRAISRIANMLFKLAFPIKGIREYTCGFRAYRVGIIQDALAIFGNKFIDLKGLGFTGTLEKLIKLRMMKARITEIPFVLRYDQKYSQSKVVTSITTLGCLVLIIKHRRFWGLEGRLWKRKIEERLEAKRLAEAPVGSQTTMPRPKRATVPENPSLEDVRRFWEANPLFVGEARNEPGSKAFFEEHERITRYELDHSLIPFALRGVGPSTRVLDVGCGIGFWVHRFAEVGADVSACDLTECAVALTQARKGFFDLSADVRKANAEDLPYERKSFDHVNCLGVIHHTPEPDACISEFHRILRPDGMLCLSVYYRPWFLRSKVAFRLATGIARRLMRLEGRGREGMLAAGSPRELVRLYDGVENPLGRAYTKRELRRMLDGLFAIESARRYGLPRRSLRVGIPAFAHRLLDRVMGLMIVMRCRRLPDPAGLSQSILASPGSSPDTTAKAG